MEQWITVEESGRTWSIDASFLKSNWRCIWDAGCPGIETDPDVEGGLGCCSVGAEMLDETEAMMITALAPTLDPQRTQFAHEIAAGGALNAERTNTRVVDGACIFLNRPGFAGGHGCALHLDAIESGGSPIDQKPSVCWQLPIKIETEIFTSEDGVEGERRTLRRWSRSDWGQDGTDMAFCCTEPGAAYSGDEPVIESMAPELAALLGDHLLDQIRSQLEKR